MLGREKKGQRIAVCRQEIWSGRYAIYITLEWGAEDAVAQSRSGRRRRGARSSGGVMFFGSTVRVKSCTNVVNERMDLSAACAQRWRAGETARAVRFSE